MQERLAGAALGTRSPACDLVQEQYRIVAKDPGVAFCNLRCLRTTNARARLKSGSRTWRKPPRTRVRGPRATTGPRESRTAQRWLVLGAWNARLAYLVVLAKACVLISGEDCCAA